MKPDDIKLGLELLPAGVAALLALGWLLRKFHRGVKLLEKLYTLVNYELSHNGGGSMKDDVHGTARTIGSLEGRVEKLEDAMQTLAESNRDLWPAIEAVAKATPPEEPT